MRIVKEPGRGKSRSLWSTAALITLASAANITSANADAFDFTHVSCSGAKNEIKIVVKGVKDSVGLMSADLYPNDQEAFLKGERRVKQVKFAARAPITQFCIKAPEVGAFAIAVYHDRNANGRFDKTGIGMPNEPWGISNNPKVRFSAPPVSKALFDVTQDGAKLEIKLR